LKKKYSLKGRICYRSVYSQGTRIRRQTFNAFVLKNCSKKKTQVCNQHESNGKLGVVVTKRIGKAHERNKARRRFRAAFSQSITLTAFDHCIIVRLHDNFLDIDFDFIKSDIQEFLKRTGYTCK
jgi:ribonuclease P protein component